MDVCTVGKIFLSRGTKKINDNILQCKNKATKQREYYQKQNLKFFQSKINGIELSLRKCCNYKISGVIFRKIVDYQPYLF